MEKIKKRLQKVFQNNGLVVIIERNKKIVKYLDVTFNFNNGPYRPYQKPNNIIQYIHVESNHPPNIIKQIPKTTQKCLSQVSPNDEIFKESAPFYEDKLHLPGQQEFKCNPVNAKTDNKRNHKRNITWFIIILSPLSVGMYSQKLENFFLIYLISIFFRTTVSTRSSTETASRSAIVPTKT